jgi:ATP-dependent RNA helicase DeaD
MLKIGFRDEIEEIMQKTPENKRTLLFSATLPKPIMNIVNNYMDNPEKVSIKS